MENKDKRYYDAFLRFGRADTQNVYTQPNLIRDILSKIPFMPNDKIFVWYNVEFAILLVKEFDFNPKDIYIYTNSKEKLILQRKGFNVVYQEEIDLDKIEKEYKNMKFDAVIGNPPFLKGLWRKILDKSIKISNGCVIMISPDATKTFSKRSEDFNKFLISNGIQSIVDCTEYFPDVESGDIVYYYLDKNKDSVKNSLKNVSELGVAIEEIINDSGPKLSAILSNKRTKPYTSCERYDDISDGRIKNLESIRVDGPIYKFIDVDMTHIIDCREYWLTNRYFGKSDIDNTPLIEVNETIGVSSNILLIKRIEGMSVDEFKQIYLSNQFVNILNVLRGKSFDTSPRILKQLPLIKSFDEFLKMINQDKFKIFNKINE